jgi:hypothetical protein
MHGRSAVSLWQKSQTCLHIIRSCRPAPAAGKLVVHPKLRNISLHNVTHSLMSQNPRERIFVVHISLYIVTFLSLIS